MSTGLCPDKRKDLVNDYLTKRYSNIELAKMYGVTSATIRNLLIRDGVYVPQRSTENSTWSGRRFNTHQTFLDRIKVSESGCWEWQKTKDRKGYGRITIDGVFWQTHRYSYQYYKGPIGELYVCHKCDNPCCCNPDHLFLGDAYDNALDMLIKGRSGKVKLTVEAIFKIRELYQSGASHKKICEEFGLKRGTVDHVIKRSRWSHLTEFTVEQYQTLNQNNQS